MKMNHEKIYLGAITRVISTPNSTKTEIIHKKFFATLKEFLDTQKAINREDRNKINREVKDPKIRELLLKISRLTLHERTKRKLLQKRKEEYVKRLEEKERKGYEEWERRQKEECYKRFLKEFRLDEERLKKRLGKENFKALKDLKEIGFFTSLFYEPLFVGGQGNKKEPIEMNPKYGEEKPQRERVEFLYNLLFRFFWKMIEIKVKSFIKKSGMAFYPEEWEDLRSEVFIKFEEAKEKYNPERAEIWTFLSTVADNTIRNISKKKGVKNVELTSEIAEKETILEETIQKEEVKQHLHTALKKLLTNEERAVINSIYFKNLNQEEVAKRLNKSQATISRIHRKGLQKLRRDPWLNSLINAQLESMSPSE